MVSKEKHLVATILQSSCIVPLSSLSGDKLNGNITMGENEPGVGIELPLLTLFHVPGVTLGAPTSNQQVVVDQGDGRTIEETIFQGRRGRGIAVRCWGGQADRVDPRGIRIG